MCQTGTFDGAEVCQLIGLYMLLLLLSTPLHKRAASRVQHPNHVAASSLSPFFWTNPEFWTNPDKVEPFLGLYIISTINESINFECIGLYRDDGLAELKSAINYCNYCDHFVLIGDPQPTTSVILPMPFHCTLINNLACIQVYCIQCQSHSSKLPCVER